VWSLVWHGTHNTWTYLQQVFHNIREVIVPCGNMTSRFNELYYTVTCLIHVLIPRTILSSLLSYCTLNVKCSMFILRLLRCACWVRWWHWHHNYDITLYAKSLDHACTTAVVGQPVSVPSTHMPLNMMPMMLHWRLLCCWLLHSGLWIMLGEFILLWSTLFSITSPYNCLYLDLFITTV
jgi:hypothetical protein